MNGSRPMNSKAVLTERLANVVICYEKFLAVRLAKVAEALTAQAPELCHASGFLDSWRVARSMQGGLLARAVRQPMLDAWVKTAERLLEIGVHEHYPHAHFVRHLKDFARLVLSWASAAPEGAEGRVNLLGRRAVPLMFGRLLLEVTDYSPGEVLTWRVAERVLRIELSGRGTLAEISLSGAAGAGSLDSRCRLLEPPVLGGAVVDVWTPEYTGERQAAVSEDSVRRWAERTQAALTEGQVASISGFCRAWTVSSPDEGWVAGLVRLDSPLGDVSPGSLVERAHRDCLERLLRLNPLEAVTGPLTVYGNPHTLLVELGARRVTSRLFDEQLSGADAALWEVIATHLQTSTAGQVFLSALGEEVEPPAQTVVPQSGEELLPLADVLRASGVESPIFDGLHLRKTRRASAVPTDWRAIDSLQYLTPAELEQIYRTTTDGRAPSEASAYCAAVISYILGDFEACRGALLRCLRHDADVEEYWHLMAFTMRHLGRYQAFTAIVFGDERDPSAFESLPGGPRAGV